MCTGDMGEPQMKKYDIETWMPSRNGYGETMSNSIMGDFQTRRLNIKYRKKDGTKEYCFSFNNTALASPRILIALLENFQQKDGSIQIPKALHPLTGFTSIPVVKQIISCIIKAMKNLSLAISVQIIIPQGRSNLYRSINYPPKRWIFLDCVAKTKFWLTQANPPKRIFDCVAVSLEANMSEGGRFKEEC